jgi:hypothetical protein
MSEPGTVGRSLTGVMRAMADEIAPQVRTPGSVAAQRRGHVRTVRHRIAVSGLVVLIGIAALLTIGSGTGHRPSPGPAAPTGAAPTPSTDLPRKASATTPVPAAWLNPARFPFAADLSWRTDRPADITVLTTPGDDISTCQSGDPTAFGAAPVWQLGPTWTSGSGGVPDAQLSSAQYFFGSVAAATAGLATIKSTYSRCRPIDTIGSTRIKTVTTTASGHGRIAILQTIRDPAGAPASSANEPSDSHEYVVQDGTVIYIVAVHGGTNVDATGADTQILQAMRDALDHYAK